MLRKLFYPYINLKIFLAYLFNNPFGKPEDVHGRTYRSVYKKFGRKSMVREYLDNNTWLVK